VFILNPQSGIPIYRQILDQVRRMVASGQLPPGTALPSVRDLAIRHTINPMTISRAYTMLEAEGLLERNRGKPMTVAAQRRPQVPLAARLETLDPALEALVLAAQQLELGAGDVIQALRKKWENSDATVRGRARAQ
jgi:GntR family transcriptional regulator